MFKSGVVTDLGVLPGQVYSRANGINAIGQVVGFSGLQRDSSESRAFMWSSQTGMIDIGTLGGAYAQAYAINDAGYVTGASQTQGMGPMADDPRVYLSAADSAVSAPSTEWSTWVCWVAFPVMAWPSTATTMSLAIRRSTTNDERVHAFLHDGTKMIDLGSLGGPETDSDVSVALGVNNLDQVVGYTYLPAVGEMPIQQVAFLWRRGLNGSGQMINLNKLLYGNGKNYLLFSATAINDNGQIVANAYDMRNGGVHAVLLTPTGPPRHQ